MVKLPAIVRLALLVNVKVTPIGLVTLSEFASALITGALPLELRITASVAVGTKLGDQLSASDQKPPV